jgi:hypothetical protein
MDQEVPNEGVQCIALHRKGVINKFDAKKNPNKGGRGSDYQDSHLRATWYCLIKYPSRKRAHVNVINDNVGLSDQNSSLILEQVEIKLNLYLY